MNDQRIRRALEPGTTVLVGTTDGRNIPSCCRGVALTSDDGLATATVYVPIAASHDTVRNLATTKRIAVAATHPIDHCSIQLKGTSTEVRLASDAEATFVNGRIDAVAEVLHAIGVPRRLVRRLAFWPAFAVTMRVEQIFEQTPGPNAGRQLR